MKFGIQLYSLKNEIAKRGVDEIFALVKKAGFDCVEFAGFYDLTPAEMKALLDKHGLEGESAHIRLENVLDSLEYVDEIGINSIYIPSLPKERLKGDLEEIASQINEIQLELEPRSVKFGYHNHAYEYEDGDLVKDLLDKTLNFYSQIDACWVKAAGIEPTDKMREYGDRLGCLHVKELVEASVEGAKKPAPIVGEGVVGAKAVIELGVEMGIEVFILEVEGMCCDAEEYLTRSCANMKKYAGVESDE